MKFESSRNNFHRCRRSRSKLNETGGGNITLGQLFLLRCGKSCFLRTSSPAAAYLIYGHRIYAAQCNNFSFLVLIYFNICISLTRNGTKRRVFLSLFGRAAINKSVARLQQRRAVMRRTRPLTIIHVFVMQTAQGVNRNKQKIGITTWENIFQAHPRSAVHVPPTSSFARALYAIYLQPLG